MNKLGKTIFFISSYIPLYLLMIILNFNIKGFLNGVRLVFNKNISMKVFSYIWMSLTVPDYLVIMLIIISLFSLILLVVTININSGYPEELRIISIANNNIELLNYVVVYIFSFANSMFSEFKDMYTQKFLVFVLLFALIGYFFIKSNLLYINPVIYFLFKYNIYRVNTSNSEVIILTKLSLHDMKKLVNTCVYPEIISEGIYVLK